MTTPWALAAAPAAVPGTNFTDRSSPGVAAEAIVGQASQDIPPKRYDDPTRKPYDDLAITNESSRDEVAAMIVQYAKRRWRFRSNTSDDIISYNRDDTIAVLEFGLLSGLKPTAEDAKKGTKGIFQQNQTYKRRDNPNEQVHEFFDRLDDKRNDPRASPYIEKNIFWLWRAPDEKSADAACNKYPREFQKFKSDLTSNKAEAEELYKKVAAKVSENRTIPRGDRGRGEENDNDEAGVSLLRPPGARPDVIRLIDGTEARFHRALGELGVNPTPAPKRDPGPDVAGVQADGKAVDQYGAAQRELLDEASGQRVRDGRVASFTDAVPPTTEKARGQFYAEARELNGHLKTYALAIRDSVYGHGATVEPPVVKALGDAMTRVEEIRQDTTLALANLAARIDEQTAAIPRDELT